MSSTTARYPALFLTKVTLLLPQVSARFHSASLNETLEPHPSERTSDLGAVFDLPGGTRGACATSAERRRNTEKHIAVSLQRAEKTEKTEKMNVDVRAISRDIKCMNDIVPQNVSNIGAVM